MVRSSLLAAAALLLALSAAPAVAADVTANGPQATLADAQGNDDTITLRRTDEGLRIYDAVSGPVTAGAGCEQLSSHTVLCPGATSFRADCGGGFDQIVGVDRTTTADGSCESVRTQDEEMLTLPAQPLAVGSRTVAMRINCPDYAVNDFGEYSECEGTVRLWHESRLVATARFDILSGRGKRVGLRLTTLGRRLVRHGPLDVLAAVDVAGNGDGGPARARWRILLGPA